MPYMHDSVLEELVQQSIQEGLEGNKDVDEELAKEIYASRFPLGVNWKEIAIELNCTPVECVRRYAELKTHAVYESSNLQVLHSPRLGDLASPTVHLPNPLLSPPPFALTSRNNPFKWEKQLELDDVNDAFNAMEMEELGKEAAEAHPFEVSASSLTHSALAEAFLDMAGSRLDAPSMLLQSRLNKLQL
ncbi:hypothetical protein THRCLA_03577 [Thraustotheca clavata]|uniref:Uncharacterized protein n=1 Tax=Thraustotheca clavata TaxID=74557 RepID=A0A1W0A1L2_9STRA|nr:hypothetical protein THRCLA_03577 [Thraustotheca clavata]